MRAKTGAGWILVIKALGVKFPDKQGKYRELCRFEAEKACFVILLSSYCSEFTA
jgi:hypothetical protein